MQYFNLQENERIIKEIKPLPGLMWYFFFSGAGGIGSIGLIFLFIFIYAFIKIPELFSFALNFWVIVGIIVLIGMVINFILSFLRYSKQYYWITNKRVVYKRGIIGYRITSIPFERISDIIISRTFLERIFGFGSLHIQTLAGQISGRYSLGAEGILLAVPNPEETQELIFQLIKEKRKEEKISF